VAAHEILVGTNAVRNLIRENQLAQLYSMIQVGSRFGMQTMEDAVSSLLEADIISEETARQALSAEWPRPAAFIGSGGSIPVAGYIKSILGMESMLIGFGRDDDAIHSPNEHFGLDRFLLGCKCHAALLAALGSESAD